MAVWGILAGVVVLAVPGVAAARLLPPDVSDRRAATAAVAFAGLPLAVVALWLVCGAFGVSATTALGAPLALGVLLVVVARGRRRTRTAAADETPLGGLAAVVALSLVIVIIPFLPFGMERIDGIHRMSMTDWEKHLVMASGVAASSTFPPPHPFLHADPDPSYYFGFQLVGAAVHVGGGRSVGLFPILFALTLGITAATPFVVYVVARDVVPPRQALWAAAAASLLIGFDAAVMALETLRTVIAAWPLPGGFEGLRLAIPSTNIDFWLHNYERQFDAPIATVLWSPHQNAAALSALLAVWLLAPAPGQPERPRGGWLLPGLLIAATPALSAYVAMGLGVGIASAAMFELVRSRRAPWHLPLVRRWLPAGVVALLLAAPMLPMLARGGSSGLVLHVSDAGRWTNLAIFSSVFGQTQWARLLDTPAIYLLEFGVIGLLGTLEVIRRWRGNDTDEQQRLLAVAAFGILVLVAAVRPPVGIGNNFYARAPLLTWFMLAPFAAAAAARCTAHTARRLAVAVCAVGTMYLVAGNLAEGLAFWGTPRSDVEMMRWVTANTSARAVVAVHPDAVTSRFGYWMHRPFVYANPRLARLFGASDEQVIDIERQLLAAYSAGSGGDAARRFDRLGADIVVVRDSVPDWTPCFDASYRNDVWVVLERVPDTCESP